MSHIVDGQVSMCGGGIFIVKAECTVGAWSQHAKAQAILPTGLSACLNESY